MASEPKEASFDPSAAVPAIPGAGGQLAVEQIRRPPTVLYTLGLRCACGVRLCGCEYWFFVDTLFVRGVCLRCGEQELMFTPSRVHCGNSDECQAQIDSQDVAVAIEDLRTSEAALRTENDRLRRALSLVPRVRDVESKSA